MLNISLNHLLNSTQLHVKIDDTTPKIYAIKGPSGIGKTTILNMLAGLSNQIKRIYRLTTIY